MTLEEAKEALEELKKDYDEEDILKILYLMYQKDELTLSDLRTFTELLGWKFTDEFEAMSEADKKTKGLKDKPKANRNGRRQTRRTSKNHNN